MHIGSKVKPQHVDEIVGAVSPRYLLSDDPVRAVFLCSSMRMTHIVMTDRRLIGISHHEIGRGKGVKFETAGVCIRNVAVGVKFKVDIADGSGLKSMGVVPGDDVAEIERFLAHMRTPAAPALAAAAPAPAAAAPAASTPPPGQARARVAPTGLRSCVIGSVNEKTLEEVRRSLRRDEQLEWIAGEAGNGALAAFADRCMVIKKGGMTTFMAGSFGGGRVATFTYGDITGIEFNSGLFMGVLEILTPSYQGTANQDFWKGSLSPVNANASSPFALSNTLPMSKAFAEQLRPQLDWMRQQIAAAKRPVIHVAAPAAPASPPPASLASELDRIVVLHQQGLLDEAEFKAAKRTLLAS